MRRGVRAGRRSSPAKRVYGLKPVSRVQISPSPPHTQVKRRVTVKGNLPFLRLNGVKFGAARGGVHAAVHTFGRMSGILIKSTAGIANRFLSCRAATAMGTQSANVIGREQENPMLSISTVELVSAQLQTTFRPSQAKLGGHPVEIKATPYSSVDIFVLGI